MVVGLSTFGFGGLLDADEDEEQHLISEFTGSGDQLVAARARPVDVDVLPFVLNEPRAGSPIPCAKASGSPQKARDAAALPDLTLVVNLGSEDVSLVASVWSRADAGWPTRHPPSSGDDLAPPRASRVGV